MSHPPLWGIKVTNNSTTGRTGFLFDWRSRRKVRAVIKRIWWNKLASSLIVDLISDLVDGQRGRMDQEKRLLCINPVHLHHLDGRHQERTKGNQRCLNLFLTDHVQVHLQVVNGFLRRWPRGTTSTPKRKRSRRDVTMQISAFYFPLVGQPAGG